MNDKLHTVFAPSGCIADEVLLRYSGGELTHAEKHAVEKHLAGCEMCSDAVEGLMLLKDGEKARSLAASVSRESSAKAGGSSGTNVIRMEPRSSWSIQVRVAAAVAVLVLAAGGYYFINRGTESLHKDILAEQAPAPPEVQMPKDEPASRREDTGAVQAGTYSVTVMDSYSSLAANADSASAGSSSPSPAYYHHFTVADKDTGITLNSGVIAMSGNAQNLKSDSVRTYNWSFADSTTVAYNATPIKAEQLFAPAAPQDAKAETEDYSMAGAKKAKSKADDKAVPAAEADALNKKQAAEKTEAEEAGKIALAEQELKKAEEIKSAEGETKRAANSAAPKSTASRSRAKPAYSSAPSKKGTSKDKAAESLSLAEKKYSEKNYKSALNFYEEVLKEKPDNYEALYYAGECYQRTGQPDKAIAALAKVLKEEKGAFYDDALWYKALAHLDKNETAAAKELLEKEIKVNGRFKAEAEEKLKTLR